MKKVNLAEKFAAFSEHWRPKVVGELNGQEAGLVSPFLLEASRWSTLCSRTWTIVFPHTAECATNFESSMSSLFENRALSNPKAALLDDDLAALRRLSLEERGRLIESACRTAAEILAGRRQCGLPDEQPAPWPTSTFEFLKRSAGAHRET
jgi:hypothetical protein